MNFIESEKTAVRHKRPFSSGSDLGEEFILEGDKIKSPILDLNIVKPKTLIILTAFVAILSFCHSAAGQTYTVLKSFGIISNVSGFNPQSKLVQGSDGLLYGTTHSGEGIVQGVIFKVSTNGTGFTALKLFTNSVDGTRPSAGLTMAGSTLYGTASGGGTNGNGTIFKVNTDGTGYTVIKNFTGTDGADPVAALVLSGGILYGTTYGGGSSSNGTVFKVNTDGTGYTVIKNFSATMNDSSTGLNTNIDGAKPQAALILSGNVLYGTANAGGAGYGNVFKVNIDGTGYTVLNNFTGTNGQLPEAGLTLSGNVLYGTTYYGGVSIYGPGYGTVFKVNTDGTGYAVIKNFNENDGESPQADLILSGNVLYGTTYDGGSTNYYGNVFKVNTDGTGYTVLKSFTGTDGANPQAGLALSGSVLYGTTYSGGIAGGGYMGYGVLFSVTTNGTGYTVLKNFTYSDGAYPATSLTLSSNTLYGTAATGSSKDYGIIYKLNTNGTGYTEIKNFSGIDGQWPANLTLSGGVLYGTTYDGGTNYSGGASGSGTVFKINTDGTGFNLVENFTSSTNGHGPKAGVSYSSGVLYGCTIAGGTNYDGTVYKVNSDGTGYTVLKNFTGTDGIGPQGLLTLSGSTLYGTTYQGGSFGAGTVFKLNTDGTGFTVIKNFSTVTYNATSGLGTNIDGANPYAGVAVVGSMLYGTANQGGIYGAGTVFKLNTDGTGYTVIKTFPAITYARGIQPTNTDGGSPVAGVIVSSNILYGTTVSGGTLGCGTMFQVYTDGSNYRVIKTFTGSDGSGPQGPLTLSGSVIYGTTGNGGALDEGTVFSFSLPTIPQLAISTFNTNVVLTWSTNFPGFTLQATTNLSLVSTSLWSTITPGPSVVNGQYTVTNAISGSRKLFRLIQ